MTDVYDPERSQAIVYDFKAISKARKPQGVRKSYDQAFNMDQWNNATPWGFFPVPETD
jgi:hypothetical protein